MRGVIVALDLPSAEGAVAMAEDVADHVAGFKIGLGLLHGPGPLLISALVALGKPVFADAKLHDIPSQVEVAARRLGEHGARWVTAHVGGGQDMLEAAVRGLRAGAGAAPAGVLGVTVLTSLDEPSLARVGINRTPGELVSRMAKVADASGCEGVVSSPKELIVVADVAPNLLRVTPGIRPIDRDDDQARTMTPFEAVERGADLLVVGRPITAADEPRQAAAAIAAEVEAARSSD
ncbi:MAG: orotidine-5'-phosphate decarboxylase [Actinomycetota bacterium]|nr:orotidine-5'-phosphate decarboxylase [Actinomycetota bacterium]